jgi:hypothetical protein
MNRKKLLLGVFLILFIGLLSASPVGAKMYKEIAMGVGANMPQDEGDRWYMLSHGPEVALASGPWIARYWLWLPYEPPEEAVERFGAVRGRYCELWFREEDYADRPPLSGPRQEGLSPEMQEGPPPGMREGPPPEMNASREGELPTTTVMVPGYPTDFFLDTKRGTDVTNVLRWVTMIRYPEGVSVEDGEKWFLEVHAKEAAKQPGLLKFVSYRVADIYDGGFGGKHGRTWDRVCEYWYTDFDAWRKAVLESPPKYTAPPWGGEYPFTHMGSTFIPYHHDVDFMNRTYQVDFDRPRIEYRVSP